MLLSILTKRTDKAVASVARLYSHSALSITVEMPCEVYEGKRYLLTMTKDELLNLVKIIQQRELEIKEQLHGN